MNFASQLSKQIQKTKKQERKKRKGDDKGLGNKSQHSINVTGATGNDSKRIKRVEEQKSNVSQAAPAIEDAAKNDAIISDAELAEKLTGYNQKYDPSDKPGGIRTLRALIKQDRKHRRYELQQQKEAVTDKQIKSEDITDDDALKKDKLMVQIRVYIKQLVRQCEQIELVDKSLLYETKLDLVLLLYKLRTTNGLSRSIVVSLATICYELQNKNYRKANESYMKLSLGNVAWPIGVMNVGIHERSKSVKTMGNNKTSEETFDANIMIDDKTRKWIVAIKRLITLAEKNNLS